MKKVLFLGAGNMVKALVSGYSRKDQSLSLHFFTPSKVKAKSLADEFQGTFVEKAHKEFDIFVLGFKPQNYVNAITEYKELLKGKTIWSLLAGISYERLVRDFPDSKIVRTMPNTCSRVGEGITLYTCEKNQDLSLFKEFFSASSLTQYCQSDDEVDRLTGAFGSGTALLFEYILGFKSYLSAHGVSGKDSRALLLKLLSGSSKLAYEDEFKVLQEQITSKKGVTEAALMSLRQDRLKVTIKEALDKAYAKTQELKL